MISRRLPVAPLYALLAAACAATTPSPRTAPGARPPAAMSSPANTGARQRWLEMFARGYFPGRSGQIFVVPREGDVITDRDPLYRFMHGSPWEYDTRIPLIFYGAPFVRPMQSADAV